MTAALAIVRVTLRQLLGGRRMVVLGLLALVPALVIWLVTANRPEAGVFDDYHEVAIPILFLIVLPITSLVLGAASLGEERRDGTLSFLVVRPLRRTTITGAKLVGAWIAATGFVAAGGAVTAAAAIARGADAAILLPTVVGVAVSAACYSAVFMLLGHVTSRAVLIGLVYVFIWESAISAAAPSLANVSLFRIGLTAYVGLLEQSAPLLDDPLGSLTPGVGGALLKTLVIGVVAVVLGASLLRRRDVT